jgi:hypothetical protein
LDEWLGILLPLGFRISFPVSLFISDGLTKGAEDICSKFKELMNVAKNGHSLMNQDHERNLRTGIRAQLKEIDKECSKFGFFNEVVDTGLTPPMAVRNERFCYSILGSDRKPKIPGTNPPALPDPADSNTFPDPAEFAGLCQRAEPEALLIETPPNRGGSYAVLLMKNAKFKKTFCACEERYCLGDVECGIITEDGDIIPAGAL